MVRDGDGRVERIIEERDIQAMADGPQRRTLLSLTEGNCPLYAIRARTLHRYLGAVTNANAQGQFYLTDIVEAISRDGGEVRTITTAPSEIEYDLLCADVTRPGDLAAVERALGAARGLFAGVDLEAANAARALAAGRTPAQVESIARQLREVIAAVSIEEIDFEPGEPVSIGVSGGRVRIAFMHPDMGRFYGPAWQMPIGAGTPESGEQVVILMQAASDGRVHLFPVDPNFREKVNQIPSDSDLIYPGDEVSDVHSYEGFGTQMSENVLLSLGYFSQEEIEARQRKGVPLPPASLWVANSMRRPFALVMNALASMRTLRHGHLGRRVQQCLGREGFRGLRIVSTGNIPKGGFSSSSAVVVAVENAVNALFGLDIAPDTLVRLACQAEYGTGVRAGSLDQATEQKGRLGQGTLMSSNPRENYRVIRTYPVPAERFRIFFPYSVDRDRTAWRWCWGFFGEAPGCGVPTAAEVRKMTGKAAEIAAILTLLPADVDFFQPLEDELVSHGVLGLESRRWAASQLLRLPLAASKNELLERALGEAGHLAMPREKAEAVIRSLFAGWSEPPAGVPLRAMVAYLFGEVAKNFYLIHNPETWIESVTWSQRGDCCFAIDPGRLPPREEMEGTLEWERPFVGPARLDAWLTRVGAERFDFNRGLDDASLQADEPPEFHRLAGSNFFRGLALIDLAEAMVKRAFGADAVAVRVNAAGQGDYFQVHVDQQRVDVEDVKQFLRVALYRRFGLNPSPDFVEVHPGGGAAGVRLSSYEELGEVVRLLGEVGARAPESRL